MKAFIRFCLIIYIFLPFLQVVANNENQTWGKLQMKSLKGDNLCAYFLKVRVADQEGFFLFDTGSAFPFSFHPPFANGIKNKHYAGRHISYDYLGNSYESPRWDIDQIEIAVEKRQQPIIFNDITIKGTHPIFFERFSKFEQRDISSSDTENFTCSGIIGFPFLLSIQGINSWILDFPNHYLYLIKNFNEDKAELEKDSGYSFNTFISAPLEILNDSIYLYVSTDEGTKKFFIDTGCSNTYMIKQEEEPNNEEKPVFSETKVFKIGDFDFGTQKVILQSNIKLMNNADGILGNDFFHDKVAIIHISDKMMLIG